jgi:hypothetical protein
MTTKLPKTQRELLLIAALGLTNGLVHVHVGLRRGTREHAAMKAMVALGLLQDYQAHQYQDGSIDATAVITVEGRTALGPDPKF